jgi:hypothetical protein
MPDDRLAVQLELSFEPDLDPEEEATLARRLRQTLSGLDVDGVDFAPLPTAAAGAKGMALDWTQLLLTLSASGGVLTSVIAALRPWLTGDQRRSVTATIGKDKLTVTGISPAEQHRLITAWLKRHEKEPATG